MRTRGPAAELEARRRLAVQRVLDGFTQEQVAQFIGVHVSTVNHWMARHRQHGDSGLAAVSHPGRTPKLSRSKQNLVLGWLRKNPKSFGFPTELWTGQRIATLIQKKFKVRYHPRYICEWLVSKNFSPQKPRTKPHERDDPAIAHWLKHDLPRIQNEPGAETHISS